MRRDCSPRYASPPPPRASRSCCPNEHATRRLAVDIANSLQAGRSRHAVGRSRRRQDHVRARADPLSRRRPDDRSAEPDLHADADLRPAALPAGACRPLPRSPGRRSLPSSASTTCRRMPSCCSNGPTAPPAFCRPTASISRSRWRRKLKLEFRHARITGYGAFGPRVERMAAIARSSSPRAAMATRIAHAAAGRCLDARLRAARARRQAVILMNSPRRPDGPPVRGGKPYSAIAHLAEDVMPFVAMAQRAARARLLGAAPSMHADLDQGLLLHRGSRRRARGRAAIRRRRSRSATRPRSMCCVRCMQHELPDVLPVAPHVEHRLPPYDIDAFLIEAELLLDWYLPHLGAAMTGSERARIHARCGASSLQPRDRHAADLGAARLPFAQSALAAASASEHRPARHSRLPGCADGAGGLRPRLALAGRARRRPRAGRDRAARPLRARRGARPTPISTPPIHQALRDARRRSAPARSSAFSRGSTCATASRNICVTSRGYGAICGARSATPR